MMTIKIIRVGMNLISSRKVSEMSFFKYLVLVISTSQSYFTYILLI